MLLTCKVCGATVAVEGYPRGTIFRCLECGAKNQYTDDGCKESHPKNRYECGECGLKCSPDLKECPACGGNIVSVTPSSISQQTSMERKCTTNENVGSDAFIVNWEKNLGGCSFWVVIGLSFSIIFNAFYNFSIIKDGLFEAHSMDFAWWVITFEFVINTILFIFAIILLRLFFHRSYRIITALPLYYKWCGCFHLVDLLLLLFFAEMNSLMVVDIRSQLGPAVGCFFWAWFFKRRFSPFKITKGTIGDK